MDTPYKNKISASAKSTYSPSKDELMYRKSTSTISLYASKNNGTRLLKKYLESSDKIGRSIFVEDICANAKGYGLLYQIQRKGR